MKSKKQQSQASMLAHMNSVLNQVQQAAGRQPSKLPAQKRKKSKGQKTQTRSLGAAVAVQPKRAGIGMSDMRDLQISWVAGYTRTGNGVLGIAGSVYFAPVGASNNIVDAAGSTGDSGQVPVLGSDPVVGANYVKDLSKNFSRKIVKKCSVEFIPLQPSTANSCVIYAAPIRGAGSQGSTIISTSAVAASPTVANVIAASGSKSFASFETGSLDLSAYIAGGSGARQNEFNMISPSEDANWGSGSMDLDGVSPCGFTISGSNSTAAIAGTFVHLVVIRQTIDLLDFLGGLTLALPEAFPLSKSECTEVARLFMNSGKKGSDLIDNPLFRRLTKYVSTD